MKIAIIGTGVMGSGFAAGLLKAGHQVTVYNRTAAKAQALVAEGARLAPSAAEAVRDNEATILVLPGAEQVRQVLLSPEVKPLLKGRKFLNAATTKPEEIVALSQDVAQAGGSLSEASIMVGGDLLREKQGEFLLGCYAAEEKFWTDVLSGISTFTLRTGNVGDASRAETPILFSSMFGMVSMAYSAAAAIKLNIPQAVIERYVYGMVPGAEFFFPMMRDRNHDLAVASVDSFKVVGDTALSASRAAGFPTGVLEEMQKLFVQAVGQGLGTKNGTAICDILLDAEAAR